MLNEPETYLHLSAPLTSYLQGLYRIRAEHLQSSRWASSLSSIVSANMADKGDTPTKTSLADSQPVSKRATRAAAGTNLLGAFPLLPIGSRLLRNNSRLPIRYRRVRLLARNFNPHRSRALPRLRSFLPLVCRSSMLTPTLWPTSLCSDNRL